MSLRARILLGYWYLVALLVVSAVAAALGFHRLGSNIGTVLEDNFDSVRSSMLMLDALERQDSAVLALLLGDQRSGALLDDAEQTFARAVRAARDNVTIPEEAPVLDEIERRYVRYAEARTRLLQEVRDRPLQAYEEEAFPRFMEVKDTVFGLLDLNHRAMIEADKRAQRTARLRALGHGSLVLVALLSLVFLSQALGRSVLDRLSDLASVAAAIATGDRLRRATAIPRDELGSVAEQLNAVLDRLAEMEGSAAGRLNQERLLTLALLNELPMSAAIVSLAGAVVASSLSAGRTREVEAAARRLPSLEVHQPEESTVTVEDIGVSFRLLRASGVRALGLLAVETNANTV
jgi:methyl-accepting chemotaxis protein